MSDDDVPPQKSPGPKMPGKRRKAQILGAAPELFAEAGYEGTSLRAVAEKCGMTKAALYYHYDDKEALLKAVVEYRLTRMIEKLTDAVEGVPQDDPLARIRALVGTCARHIDEERAGWVVSSRIFWSIEQASDKAAMIALRDRFENLFRTEIARAIQAGQLADVDAGMLTRMILSWLNYLPRWHRVDGPKSAEEVAMEFLGMTLHGVEAR